MKTPFKKLSQGFTIIEVMIVLAIAGIIMAIVFLAIPQVQRNSRDNGREAAMSRVKAELESYASTNAGAYPWAQASWTSFYNSYIGASGTSKVNDAANGQSIWMGVTPSDGPGRGATNSTFVKSCGSSIASGAACSYNTPPSPAGSSVIVYGGKCGNTTATDGIAVSSGFSGAASSSTANYAFVMALDRSNTYYCVDNG